MTTWCKKHLKKTGLFLMWFLLLIIFVTITFNVTSEDLLDYFGSSLIFAMIGFIFLYGIKSITMTIPNSVLYIAAGLIFPSWLAILLTYVGLIVSATVGYFVGKKLGKSKIYLSFSNHKQVKYLLEKYKDNYFILCLMIRLLSLPFGFASFFFGASKMPYFKFIFSSLLGITPIMIPIVLSSNSISTPLSIEFLLPFLTVITVTLLIFLKYKKKMLNRHVNS